MFNFGAVQGPYRPFILNKNSLQARGLKFWAPLHPLAIINQVDLSHYGLRSTTHTGNPVFGNFNDGNIGVDFDGVDDSWKYDSAPNLDITTDSITITARVNYRAISAVIFGKQHSSTHVSPFFKYSLFATTSSRLSFRIDTLSFFTPASSFLLNTDYFVAGRYNGAVMDCFINNKNFGSTSKTGNIQSSTFPLVVGTNADGGEDYDGVLSDLRIYDRALSDAEILHIYNPATRWDLYSEVDIRPPVRVPFVPSAGAAFSQGLIIA